MTYRLVKMFGVAIFGLFSAFAIATPLSETIDRTTAIAKFFVVFTLTSFGLNVFTLLQCRHKPKTPVGRMPIIEWTVKTVLLFILSSLFLDVDRNPTFWREKPHLLSTNLPHVCRLALTICSVP